MECVFLFPGQGVQRVGMCSDLFKDFQVVKDLFQLCSDATGKDVCKLLFESDEQTLQKTDNTQIAMTLASISVAKVLEQEGIVPTVVAGFSLGEYAALVTSGIVALEDIFGLVVTRGRIMNEAKIEIEREFAGEGEVGMTAVLGLSPSDIENYLSEWNIPNVYLSMYNSPVQGVLGGTEKAMTEAAEKLSAAGAKRIIPLKVAGPFHTPLMEYARQKYAQTIENIPFSDPKITILSNVNGASVQTGSEMKQLCAEQLVKPVRWIDEEDSIHAHGIDAIYETGIGNVLSGLWKAWKREQSNKDSIPDCNALGTSETIKNLKEERSE